jgi:hypothetical protein
MKARLPMPPIASARSRLASSPACLAHGAPSRRIAWLVFGSAGRALALGLAADVLLSFLAVPILRRFLYGLNPVDPLAYVQTAVILAAAAAIATWLPARRAAAVDPAKTLRYE